ncbi:hypothetical protein RMCBS344292_02829 [Rhizopus microsporus]|nr:hypothetical protein RMCBS344292_02829 [Rhizopus microsporus]
MQWDKEQEKVSTEERLCELYETIEHQSMSFSILRQRQKAHADLYVLYIQCQVKLRLLLEKYANDIIINRLTDTIPESTSVNEINDEITKAIQALELSIKSCQAIDNKENIKRDEAISFLPHHHEIKDISFSMYSEILKNLHTLMELDKELFESSHSMDNTKKVGEEMIAYEVQQLLDSIGCSYKPIK